MFDLLFKGFFLGLSIGSTCLITCGPVFLPYVLRDKRNLRKGFLQAFYFLSGRLGGYLLFGILAGILGSVITEEYRTLIASISYILLGSFLIYNSIRPPLKQVCSAKGIRKAFQNPAILGLLTGINLCPPFALALSTAFESGGPFGGMMLFGGFFFGSALWFIPLAIFSGFSIYKPVRIISRIVGVLVALYFIYQGFVGIFNEDKAISSNKKTESEEQILSFTEFDSIYIVSENEKIAHTTDSILMRRTLKSYASIIHKSEFAFDEIPVGSAVLHLSFEAGNDSLKSISKEKIYYTVNAVLDSSKSLYEKELEVLANMLRQYYFRRDENEGFYFITEPGDG
ncbi:MAG: sulfite exporter TauE/SafE family protein [Candidatus Zixiibacteriota bacterium]